MDPYDLDGLFHDETPQTSNNNNINTNNPAAAAAAAAAAVTTSSNSSAAQSLTNADSAAAAAAAAATAAVQAANAAAAESNKRLRLISEASHCLIRSVAQVALQDVNSILLLSQAETPQAIVKLLLANRTDQAMMRSALKAYYLIMDSNQVTMFPFGRDVADIFVYALEIDAESSTRSIFVSCLSNEQNRQDLWNAGLVQKFKELLRTFPPEAIRYACETMSIFAREGAKARIMWEAGLADLAIQSLWENKNQVHVPYSVCLLLSRFTFHQANTLNSYMRVNGAETVILESMRENKFDVDSQMAAFAALFWMWDGGCARCLCPDGAGFCGCFQTKACRIFVDVLLTHKQNAAVLKLGLDTMSRLAPCIKDSQLALATCTSLVPLLRCVHTNTGGVDSLFIVLETLAPFLNEETARTALEAVNTWLTTEQSPPAHLAICARHAILMLQRDSGTTRLCELCRQKEVNHVLRDCGHACLCDLCAHIVFIRPYRVCPYPTCRKRVTKPPLRFFASGKNKQQAAAAMAGAGAVVQSDAQQDELCVVCHESAISQVFEECGHACTCKRCAEQITQNTRACPLCRKQIQHVTGFSYPWMGRTSIGGGGGIVNTLQGGTSFMF